MGPPQIREWTEARQLVKIDFVAAAGAPAGMYNSTALSRNLWGHLNLALAGTSQAREFNQVKRLNGLEAWRRIVVPLRPRSEAKRNVLHTLVHASARSTSLDTAISDLDDWEKVVEKFENCGGVASDRDKRTVLLKKLPQTTPSALVSSLRTIGAYEAMKMELGVHGAPFHPLHHR